MKRSRSALTISMLAVAVACSPDRENAANLSKEASRALTAKGMVVGEFNEVSNYPVVATRRRGEVRCAEVSRNESDCRLCVVAYEDAGAAIDAVNTRARQALLPEGAASYVRGKMLFVVEPGPRHSYSLAQEVYDELRKLP